MRSIHFNHFKPNRLTDWLLVIWLLSMIALPLAKFGWAESGLIISLYLNVIIQVGLVVWVMYRSWGLPKTVQTISLICLLTIIIEAIGTSTGLLFGSYSYTDKLQPQILHVPLLIPLAWLMMLPVSWVVAQQIAGSSSSYAFILLSGLAMTAWDLFLDPQMVQWGFWLWREPGWYFGIPLHNYLGWFLTTVFLTITIRPKPLPLFPLIWVYAIIWILQTLGQLFFWGLLGPAFFGFVGMGLITELTRRYTP